MNMIREEQIREAASAYRINDGEGVRGWEEAAFEAGARWADEHPKHLWISVSNKSEQLTYEEECLIMLKNGEVRIGTLYSTTDHGDMWSIRNEEDVPFYDISHWMPIPKLP